MAAVRKRLRIGDLLVENNRISEQQLQTALADQKKSGRKLGRILIENGYIAEDDLLQFLAQQLKVPFVDLSRYKFDPTVVKLIPEIHARRFRAIALKERSGVLQVGMSDPTNIFAFDELSRLVKRSLDVAVVREQDLIDAIERVYHQSDEISGIAEQLSDELSESDVDVDQMAAGADVADAPVVRLIQTLFHDAVRIKASDIHIEPDETVLRIRQRIDGVLHEQILNEKRIAPALVQRLKLMSGLDISEKRLPQDGRCTVRSDNKTIDVRLSTMPLQHGESIVMRLLDQSEGIPDLDELGMPEDLLTRFLGIIQRPHGLIVVTGPTGSGKTTTLYSTLKRLNRAERKIITVEDPVEYRLPRVNQVQVNNHIGLDFARILRTTLRQDPDIVLVGEMRDEETMEIGLRAAMTGHLVLSTLHTNDAIATVSRFLDMGAPGYLLAASLHAILAQRLIRRLCDGCVTDHRPDAKEVAWLQAQGLETLTEYKFQQGEGCHRCNNTGYRGRIGVYEVLEIDDALATYLSQGDTMGFGAAAAASSGYRPLHFVAVDYAKAHVSTLNEAMRVATDLDTN